MMLSAVCLILTSGELSMLRFATSSIQRAAIVGLAVLILIPGVAMATVASSVEGQAIIAADPESPAGYISLGELYLKNGNLEKASDILETGQIKARASADLLVVLSRVYEAQEFMARAESITQEALVIDQNSVAAHMRMGEIYFRMGWPKSGLDSFRQAVALAPDETGPKVKLVGGLLEAGHLDAAEVQCLEYVSVDGDNVDLWLSLGQIFEKQEKRQAAFTTYGQILVLDPNNSTAYARQGRLFCQFSQFDAAETACRKALDIDEDNALAHAYLGIACSYLGRNNEARQHATIAENAGLNMLAVWKKIGQ
jgi:Tfp pilus assembly protein PilF